MKRILLKIVGLILFFITSQSYSATYYVAKNGNDNNLGTITSPFKTISKGANILKPGDSLYIRNGIYNESITLWQSGTSSAPIKITSYENEEVIIDGTNYYPTSEWYGLIYLGGNYIDVSKLTLKNSAQRGIVLYGHHNSVHNLIVNGAKQNGILIQGDYGLVEDSEVTRSALSNENNMGNGMWAGGLNAARDGVDGISSNIIIRRNVVHDNWGEGLSAFEASNVTIEDNIVYNNYSVNLYISDARNCIVQRNIIYNNSSAPLRNGNPAAGITLADEVASKPRSTSNIIINNLLLNNNLCAFCWSIVPWSLDASIVAHNTIVNNSLSNGKLTNGSIVSNNLSNAVVIGGNVIDGNYFKPKTPTFGNLISSVNTDFFKKTRPTNPTIGGIEMNSDTSTPPPPAENLNLAFNKPVIVSSIQNNDTLGKFAVDGDKNSRWSSQFSDPQWITIDLQKTYKITQINLFWERAYSKNFNIQTSNDNVNWTNVYSNSNFTGGNQTLNIIGSGRYVRLYSLSRSTVWGVSLWEIEIFGSEVIGNPDNIALNKTTETSSIENINFIGKFAVDGDKNSRWSSQFSDPQWITIDLGDIYNISKINLLFETAYSSSYKLQVSLDNTVWTDIYYTTTSVGGTQTLSNISGVGKYIRFYGISRGTPWGHSLWEIEVYGLKW